MCVISCLYLDDFSEEVEIGEEMLIFSYGSESARVCVIEYVTGSRDSHA